MKIFRINLISFDVKTFIERLYDTYDASIIAIAPSHMEQSGSEFVTTQYHVWYRAEHEIA